MVIYLRHDRHGTKVAISEMEAKADEAKGWIRYDPVASESFERVNLETPKRKYTRRGETATPQDEVELPTFLSSLTKGSEDNI